MRKRSLIEWDDVRDRALLQALAPFRARARGRRLKELAQLGALAERAGLRVAYEPTGGAKLEGLAAAPLLTAAAASPGSTVAAMPSGSEQAVPTRSSAHQSGLEALLANILPP